MVVRQCLRFMSLHSYYRGRAFEGVTLCRGCHYQDPLLAFANYWPSEISFINGWEAHILCVPLFMAKQNLL